MKFTPGIAGDGMSGSLGSTTASRNRYGPYLRTKAVPVNPNTTRQQAIRSVFGTLVQNWIDVLTEHQRTAWDTYAANTSVLDNLGKSIFITGQNHYIRANSPRIQAGLAQVAAAPTVYNTGAPVTSLFLTTLGTVDVIGITQAGTDLSTSAFVAGGAPDDGDVLMQLGAPINVTRGFFKGPYQLAAVEAIASAATQADFDQAFTALLSDNGDPAVAQNRGIRLRIAYDDGRLSEPYSALLPVAAEAA